MKYNKELNFKLTWLIILFLPLILAILVSINVIKLPTSNDWIGFYGSIVGGLLGGLFTFYGVKLSLNEVRKQISEQKQANDLLKSQLFNDDKRYREEQRLSVRPYINEYSGKESGTIDCSAYIFEVDPQDYDYSDDMLIKIKNIGNGPIISLNIMGINQSFVSSKLDEPMNEEVKSLEVGGIMNLHVSYMTKKSYLMSKFDIKIQYFDILDNHYRQSITINAYRDELGKYKKCKIDSISKQELIVNIKNTN